MTAPDANRRTAVRLLAVIAVMIGLTAAAVPLYSLFCRVTGFGGTTNVAESGSDVILDRTVTVRFDANIAAGMPWEFRPVERSMEIRLGETGLAFYEAYNPTDRPVAGQASYNVTPYDAGYYFSKIECFCFTEQVLMPGERVQMPVSFFVDPELVDDPEAGETREITLSYTFYEIDLPDGFDLASLDAATAPTDARTDD
ncbi:cytochrome c oxidase assembly protein [Rhodobacterales bacterium HKCCE2091]|nr:cytochrome c oxidase assembly protein [Rhodobacterales bacterium HKCCE2091]